VRIDLQVGGYAIRLDEPADRPSLRWPFATFEPFAVPADRAPDLAVAVNIVRRLPAVAHGPLLYDACHGLWTWHEADGGYLLVSPDRRTGKPDALALVSRDIASAVVWMLPRTAGGPRGMAWEPMHVINPIVEACLLTRLAREGGVLLHAAGVATEGGGLAFTGPSGAGKSTLSQFYATRGAAVLSDERIILRAMGRTTQVFGTPWPGTGGQARNQRAPLQAVFCIKHGKDGHVLRRMPPGAGAALILSQCFLPHWDRAAMEGTLAFLSRTLETVDCLDLAFAKVPDVVEFIAAHRAPGRRACP
jgi:hypothetical protein